MHQRSFIHTEIQVSKCQIYQWGYGITLNVSKETLYDAEEMNDSPDGAIGYIFGSYSKDGKQIMITHVVDALNAEELLSDAFETSKGLIGECKINCVRL